MNSEAEEQFNQLALKRRMTLYEFNAELRESIEDLFANWLLGNPSIHHIELGLSEEEAEDDGGGYWSAITFHICCDDENIKKNLEDFFQNNILLKHMEMIADVIKDPIFVGVGQDHG